MKYAVIAAGHGSRLAAEGVTEHKPLVRIGGEPLIDRLLRVFMDNDAESIAVICNDRMPAVAAHLKELQRFGLDGRKLPLRYVVKSTPSSMHSFFEISRYVGGGAFCLTTVDTIFRESEFGEYIRAFTAAVKRGECDGMMGVTDYIDDEKPLYVETDSELNITAEVYLLAIGASVEDCEVEPVEGTQGTYRLRIPYGGLFHLQLNNTGGIVYDATGCSWQNDPANTLVALKQEYEGEQPGELPEDQGTVTGTSVWGYNSAAEIAGEYPIYLTAKWRDGTNDFTRKYTILIVPEDMFNFDYTIFNTNSLSEYRSLYLNKEYINIPINQ